MQLQMGKNSHLSLFQGKIKEQSKPIFIKVPPLYLQISLAFIALGLQQRHTCSIIYLEDTDCKSNWMLY